MEGECIPCNAVQKAIQWKQERIVKLCLSIRTKEKSVHPNNIYSRALSIEKGISLWKSEAE